MSVHVIDTIKPKNNGTFPVVEAVDVKVTDSKRLDAALNDKANQSDLNSLSVTVQSKASQTDLNSLSDTVSNKADKSALAETNAAVAEKQDALSTAQLTAVNSGITSALVTQIGTNTNAIADKADTTDVNTATANLQSQIDSIVTPVTQDAEVQNARVDAEGVTHTTLKARIDSTETDLNALTTPTNIFNSSMISVEGAYLKSDGSTGASEPWDITTFIPLVAGNSYAYKGLTDVGGEAPVSCFYDASRNLVGYFKQQTGYNKIVIPSGATQMKFSVKGIDIENLVVIKKSSTSINEINSSISELNTSVSSLDESVSSLDSSVDSILAPKECFDSSMISLEEHYLKSDGSTAHSEPWNITKYIKFRDKCTYKYNGLTDVGGDAPVSCFYNASGTLVGYFKQATGENIITIPNGAVKMKFSIKTIDIANFSVMEYPSYGLSDISDEITRVDEELTENINTKISVRNVREENIDNCAWSWWTSPQVVYESIARNKYYFGHVTSDGTAGVGSFAASNINKRAKTHLRTVGADDHNGMAIFQNQTGTTGKMYLAFAFEHNTENYIHEYIGVQEHNADLYKEAIDIEFPGKVTYAQVVKDQYGSAYNESRLMLATRVDINDWYGVFSTTYYGNTWGTPKPIVKADKQYYCIFKPVSDAARVLRIIMYSNPNLSETDTRIRMGFLDMSTGYIYNANGTSKLGSMDDGGVDYTEFDVIVDVASGYRNRLLDVAVSPKNEVYIAYATFTDETDAVYYVYNNGTTAEVASCGDPFYIPSVYVGGLIFDPTDTNTIYVSRKPATDHICRIEKYTYSSGSYSMNSELYRCASSILWAIRPIITTDGKYLIFQLGTCNTGNFEQYNYDAEVIALDTQE